jgi:acetyl esterase/lipase
VAYVVALVSLWLLVSASTALRPGRRGVFAALAFPVGWAAGELAGQALVVEAALLGLLAWWEWPRTAWLGAMVLGLAALVVAENAALVAIQFGARRVVRLALARAPQRPLSCPRPSEDRFATWWRTALQFPFHPRGMQLIRDVAYGPERRHRLDLWRTPETAPNAPVIFYVHGGAWTFGDKREQGRPMLHEFVERGWIAVACNYRLAPRHPWPAQIEDVMRTLAWIKQHVAAYGGDPDRVVIAGGSAGGHLAALVALAGGDGAWRPPDAGATDLTVRGAISLYGVLEMTGDARYWNGLGRTIRRLLERRVVQLPHDGHEQLYRDLSPLHRIHPGAPPFLVVQGTNDTLVDVAVARAFVERFRAVAPAPIYYVELPLAQHAFDLTASPRTSAVTRAAVAFAESVAGARPPLAAATLASYRVPPTELLVESAPGAWVSATEAVSARGALYVVTSDNPYSRPLGDEENALRRQELREVLARHGVRATASLARGAPPWPDERGVAIHGRDEGYAAALARAFDQFAYYRVTRGGVEVCSSLDGHVLAA